MKSTELEIPPFRKVADRTPQYPLKTRRAIYSDADIARARANIALHPAARKVRESILEVADAWVDWTDEDLRTLMPDARVPRAFDVNPLGCPIHGDEIFKKGGNYPWILDPKHPFKMKCPVGGEVYPSNDYAKHYHGDLQGESCGGYVDDGWGWVSPEGERYWFVAAANHWTWFDKIVPAIRELSRAYLLTGDRKYAHKAAVMLYRLAEVYPSMDHAEQSRYGLLMKAEGEVYGGKIVNMIWETIFANHYAEAYDYVWETLDSDTELQAAQGKSGEEIRAFIEANLLEDAVDAYFDFKIDGNFGMHQTALMRILLAREQMDNERMLHSLVDEPGHDLTHTGLRYALYNQIFRDGVPHESPYYNSHWIDNFATMGELLNKSGYDIFSDARVKALFDSPLASVVCGLYTPDWGDSGSTTGGVLERGMFTPGQSGVIGRNADAYWVGYRAYRDSRYLPWLASIGQTGAEAFSTFESLFQDAPPATEPLPGDRVLPPQPSRVLAGWGMGILNNTKDNHALAVTYGPHLGHFHWDYLNFDLYANGQKMMPDIGYPDAMNERVQEVYTWGTNTVAHNTVVVDAGRQNVNKPGVLHSFGDGPFARSIDVSAQAYSQCSQYRRTMVMVDTGDDSSYTVDFFRVTGGRQHDYVLHGPPGQVTVEGGTWGAVQTGTMAGADVATGEIYDDEVLGAAGYQGVFSGYSGSGFQWLQNVQELEDGQADLSFKHVHGEEARLRIRVLPTGEEQVFMADAWDRPRAKSHLLKYLVVRRKSQGDEELNSTFVSVLEPFKNTAAIEAVRFLDVAGSDTARAVEVKRDGIVDVVLSDSDRRAKSVAGYDIETDAESAVVSFGKNDGLQRVFFSNGTYLRCGGRAFRAQSIEGRVIAIDSAAQKLTVQLSREVESLDISVLERVAFFTNDMRSTEHPLLSMHVEGTIAELVTKDSLLVGRARLREIGDKTVSSDTIMPFENLYAGVTMLTDAMEPVAVVESVQRGKFVLQQEPKVKLSPSDDVWLSNLGIGDKMCIKPVLSWQV